MADRPYDPADFQLSAPQDPSQRQRILDSITRQLGELDIDGLRLMADSLAKLKAGLGR